MLTSESTRDPKRETSRVACFCLQNPGSMLPITPLHSLVPLANVPLRCFPNSKLQFSTLPLRVNPNTICRVAQTLHHVETGQKNGFAHKPGIRGLISAETCTQPVDSSVQHESPTPAKRGGAGGGGGGAASALIGRVRKPGSLGIGMHS